MAISRPIILPTLLLVLAGAGSPSDSVCGAMSETKARHPKADQRKTEELDSLTTESSRTLPASPSSPPSEKNFIDTQIFRKIRQDNVPRAQLCSDVEFLRRVSLDLTGRLPEPESIRTFVKS